MLKTQKTTVDTALVELENRLQALRISREAVSRQAREIDLEIRIVSAEYARLVNQAAPISSFPNEILAAVFEAGHGLPSSKSECSAPFRVLVSQVCQHWREVALAASSLWTRIDAFSDAPLEMVTEYLQRSKGCGLDLRIVLRGPEINDDEHLLQLLTGHVSCCRRLSIESFSGSTIEIAPKYLCKLNVPILESIRITLDDDTWDEDKFPRNGSRIFSGGAQSLTCVQVRGNCLKYFMPPLSSLQVLHLYEGNTNSYMPVAEFIDMLKALRSLKHFILRGFTTDLTFDNPRRSITMPSLRTLDIQGAGQPISLFLYAMMPSPLLETLIAGEATQTGYHHFYSLNISEPHFPSLRTFTLRNCDVLEGAYQTWTRVFPNIRHLSIVETKGDVFLRYLLTDAPVPPWLELQTISLLLIDEIYLLLIAVDFRIKVGCPLVKVRLGRSILSALGQYSMERLQGHVEVEEYEWDPLDHHDLAQ